MWSRTGAMLAVADLCKDGPVTMTTEGIEKRSTSAAVPVEATPPTYLCPPHAIVRRHAHFAGHTLNPKTRFGEVEKAREQLVRSQPSPRRR